MRNYFSGLGTCFSKSQTRQAVYEEDNTEVHSCNHGMECNAMEKALVLFRKCVFIASGIQHKMCMPHVVICGHPGFTIFLHIVSYKARFSKNKLQNLKCVF